MRSAFCFVVLGITLTAGTFALTGGASADGVKVGVLTCHESSGWGFVLGSTKHLHCTFSNGKGYAEQYEGKVSKFGVDIGYTSSAVIIWDVVAPNSGAARGALAGDYAGAQASVALGGGIGANALVGGLHRSVALQPVSIEGETGLNVAAGIGAISLRFVRAEGNRDLPPPPQQ
ncbi:MAG: DUF992 domain-containing protein [Rhizomicrobium sp.]|jgi:hypothetical protein